MWLTDKADWRSLLSRLGTDVKAELLAQQIRESSKEQRETPIQELRAVAESGRMQLFGAYDGAKNILKRFDQDFGTIEGPTTSAREQTFKRHDALQEEMREENVPPSELDILGGPLPGTSREADSSASAFARRRNDNN